MPQLRRLAATTAIVATLLLVSTSIASAHPGHPRFGPAEFDNICIGDAAVDTFPGDEDCTTNDGRDKFVGRGAADILDGGARRDLIRGNRGDDAIEGGEGRDLIYAGHGSDTIDGGDQGDKIFGGPGADDIIGGGGRDLIKAGRGADSIAAADGQRDWIFCGRGDDSVTADRKDRVHGSCEDVKRVD